MVSGHTRLGQHRPAHLLQCHHPRQGAAHHACIGICCAAPKSAPFRLAVLNSGLELVLVLPVLGLELVLVRVLGLVLVVGLVLEPVLILALAQVTEGLALELGLALALVLVPALLAVRMIRHHMHNKPSGQ